jgi:small-conductance mechanosensitive channel
MDALSQASESAEMTLAALDDEEGSATVDLSPEGIYTTVKSWIDGFFLILPNLFVALVVILIFYAIAVFTKWGVKNWATRRGRENLGDVLGGFLKAVVIALGLLLAITIVLPTLNPGDLVAGLGIGSVAIGFAFKDILQNWLAGLLILLRQPFRPGDQIIINAFEGTVDHIETRVTAIRTYDGRMALIPNSNVYTEAVTVNTAFDKRRSYYDVGIGYGDDISKAKEAILKAVGTVQGVERDPQPDVLVADLAASWITLRLRWGTESRRTDVVLVSSHVVEAVKAALDEEGVDMPFETIVQLFHDQTEETDGVRGRQREGWPQPADTNEVPQSRLQLTLQSEF